MRQDQAVADISALLKARNPLLWIVSPEELRVERALIGVAGSLNMRPLFWDVADGLTNADGSDEDPRLTDPVEALKSIGDTSSGGRVLYVMRDLHNWMDPVVKRTLRSLARKLQGVPEKRARAVVILSSSSEVPPELVGQATIIDWPLPDRVEMGKILDEVVESVPDDVRDAVIESVKNGNREAAIDAAVGLTAANAENAYAHSVVTQRKIDPALVAAEKKRVVSQAQGIEWYDPDPRGLDAIGGLDLLKDWLGSRKEALGPEARAYGLPAPKGMVLLGPPGTGKSQTAKSVATAWGLPLLRLDVGGLKSKYVGDSEQNIRQVFKVVDSVAPCILWLDEIEKALAGSTGAQGDGGVASDQLNFLLGWLQDRSSNVFVIATANDVKVIAESAPELLRKGRWDALWFIDLPTSKERAEILVTALRHYDRDPALLADEPAVVSEIVAATEKFSGAEIDALIPDALYKAFAEGKRPLTAKDILIAAEETQPLAETAKEKIDFLRDWAERRTRFASTPEAKTTTAARRRMEL